VTLVRQLVERSLNGGLGHGSGMFGAAVEEGLGFSELHRAGHMIWLAGTRDAAIGQLYAPALQNDRGCQRTGDGDQNRPAGVCAESDRISRHVPL